MFNGGLNLEPICSIVFTLPVALSSGIPSVKCSEISVYDFDNLRETKHKNWRNLPKTTE